MQTAQWIEDGVEIVERTPSDLPPGWVRLRVTGCGICGSDLHIYRGVRAGTVDPAEYSTPGHEIAGTIANGPVGLADAVYAVEPWVNCRDCVHCLGGEPTRCADANLLGISARGGLAEMVDVPQRLLHQVDDRVDGAIASMAEPWAVAVRAIHRAQISELGERVLILGGGNIGLLCGLAVRERVARVGVTCRYDHQAEMARQLGLEPVSTDDVEQWAAEYEPGVVIETVGGEADTMAEAISCCRSGGRIVVVGVFGTPRPTDYRALVLKELEVTGSFIYGTVGRGSEFGVAVGRMQSITSELASLQTNRFPLQQVARAFEVADDKASRAIKVTIGV